MKALVLFDSVFGNTQQIAAAIAKTLESQADVAIIPVAAFQPEQLNGLDLFIVGSPTRGFRATESIQKSLKGLPNQTLEGIKVAAFDTRLSNKDVKSPILSGLVKFFGYAAQPIAKELVQKGGHLALAPEGFFVEKSEGPLKEGELQRAADWAGQVIKA